MAKLEELNTNTFSTISRDVYEAENEHEQIYKLVLHVALKGNMEDVLNFWNCLRQCHPLLARVVIDGDAGDKALRDALKQITEEKIKSILEENVTLSNDQYITYEDLHVYIEEKLGSDISLDIVTKMVCNQFALVTPVEGDWKFRGITWQQNNNRVLEEVADDNEGEMDFNTFVMYVAEQFKHFNLEKAVETAMRQECLSEDTFIDLDESDLKEAFGKHMEYVVGIKNKLKTIQKERRQNLKLKGHQTGCSLREFDTSCKKDYCRGLISYEFPRNMLSPVHKFLYSRSMKTYLIVKETIQFVAACLNARQNGTIHFGIEAKGPGVGMIHGILDDSQIRLNTIDLNIRKGIALCFMKEYVEIVQRCVRPIQKIVVDKTAIVLEVDIVPYSCLLKEIFFNINFPPKGPQSKHYLDFGPSFHVRPVPQDKVSETIEFYRSIAEQRMQQELEKINNFKTSTELGSKLTKELTLGAEYVTDELVPVFFLGTIPDNFTISNNLKIENALKSSVAIFDFNSSTRLRKETEHGKPYFTVKKVEDFDSSTTKKADVDKSFPKVESMWIYCNGNDDLENVAKMNMREWMDMRLDATVQAMNFLKHDLIPQGRAKVIFLIFEKVFEGSQLLEIARQAFLICFKGQCVIIGESETDVEDYKRELSKASVRNIDVEKCIFTGLKWIEISNIFQSIFIKNANATFKISHHLGYLLEFTNNDIEEMNFSSIEILSAEQCKSEGSIMTEVQRKANYMKEELRFYQGNLVSWWNFYYGDQVIERETFSKHREEIENILLINEQYLATYEIAHHPGAGGSTLGRHLIWYFSQKKMRRYPYRCCVAKKLTESTVEEIERFRKFKDDSPNPVIILVDDEKEGLDDFMSSLRYLAFRTALPGKLFALIIQISRVSMSHSSVVPESLTIRHYLSEVEALQFETKFTQLQNDSVRIRTLIAFNVMRHAFDKKYIKKEVEDIMKDVTDCEREILKSLALVGFFGNGQVIPQSVFDIIMTGKLDQKQANNSSTTCPGTVPTMRQRQKLNRPRAYQQIWNVEMTEALSILICKRGNTLQESGICIVSQLLAEEIMKNILEKESLTLEQLTVNVLDLARKHADDDNELSKTFVSAICKLFISRHALDSENESKARFSQLVIQLGAITGTDSEQDANERVIRVMDKCFQITKDAIVGQQLARYNIMIQDYEAAERAISTSLKFQSNNSYLHDTYGQVFKTQMEQEINKGHRKEEALDEAKCIIDLAFKALDRFLEGQIKTFKCEDDSNDSCYMMELSTFCALLNYLVKYVGEEEFVDYLNNTGKPMTETILKIEGLKDIQLNGKRQDHAQETLRFIDEQKYQVRKKYRSLNKEYEEHNDRILKGSKKVFNRFYNKTSAGISDYGLKQMMLDQEDTERRTALEQRVDNAKQKIKLKSSDIRDIDGTDLLVYVGYKIIQISHDGEKLSDGEYKELLNLSSKLLEKQQYIHRPYVEAYLYFAILHFPTKAALHCLNQCKPSQYKQHLKEWDRIFKKNNHITTSEQIKSWKPKTYFALGQKESYGNAIVDVDYLEAQFKMEKEKNEGRIRKYVLKDHFWRVPDVANKVERLTGTLNDSGSVITYQVTLDEYKHVPLDILVSYPSEVLKNRKVTFVLGFTWGGLRAFDLLEPGAEDLKPYITQLPIPLLGGFSYDPTVPPPPLYLPHQGPIHQPSEKVCCTCPLPENATLITDANVESQNSANLHIVNKTMVDDNNTMANTKVGEVPISDTEQLVQDSMTRTNTSVNDETKMDNETCNVTGQSIRDNQDADAVNTIRSVEGEWTPDMKPIATVKQSAEIVTKMLSCPPTQLCICWIKANVGQKKNCMLLFMVFAHPDIYYFQLHQSTENFVKEGRLGLLLQCEQIKKVSYDVEELSLSLLRDYDTQIRKPFCDIKKMYEIANMPQANKDYVQKSFPEFRKGIFKTWREQDLQFAQQITANNIYDTTQLNALVRRGKLILQIYQHCICFLSEDKLEKLHSELKSEDNKELDPKQQPQPQQKCTQEGNDNISAKQKMLKETRPSEQQELEGKERRDPKLEKSSLKKSKKKCGEETNKTKQEEGKPLEQQKPMRDNREATKNPKSDETKPTEQPQQIFGTQDVKQKHAFHMEQLHKEDKIHDKMSAVKEARPKMQDLQQQQNDIEQEDFKLKETKSNEPQQHSNNRGKDYKLKETKPGQQQLQQKQKSGKDSKHGHTLTKKR